MIGDTDFLGWQCVGGLSFPDNFIATETAGKLRATQLVFQVFYNIPKSFRQKFNGDDLIRNRLMINGAFVLDKLGSVLILYW